MKLQTKTNPGNSCCHCWNFKPWRVGVGNQKNRRNQWIHIASSSTKEDKEVIKQKQLAYLKEHEQENDGLCESTYANIHQVSYDWDSIKNSCRR